MKLFLSKNPLTTRNVVINHQPVIVNTINIKIKETISPLREGARELTDKSTRRFSFNQTLYA